MSYLNFFNSDPTPNLIPAPQSSQPQKQNKTKQNQVWESLQAVECASRYTEFKRTPLHSTTCWNCWTSLLRGSLVCFIRLILWKTHMCPYPLNGSLTRRLECPKWSSEIMMILSACFHRAGLICWKLLGFHEIYDRHF